jgi:hypothetical protein
LNETSACALAFFNEHSGHKLCFFRRTTLVIAILDQFIKPIEAFKEKNDTRANNDLQNTKY